MNAPLPRPSDRQRAFVRAQMSESLRLMPPAARDALAGSRLLVTGASGFFGAWILVAAEALNAQGAGLRVQALSRGPSAFADRWPELAGNLDPQSPSAPWLQWLDGGFERLADAAPVDGILHLAGSSDKAGNDARPFLMAQMTLDGAVQCAQKAQKDKARWLLASSGAIYGSRSASQGPAREEDAARSAPEPMAQGSAPGYGHAKRLAEWVAAQAGGVIARPFAFAGPLLPLDWHFAAGNFARDALADQPIRLLGDGTPLRSYMHPADLAVWILSLWALGEPAQAYNVGGEERVSLWELAERFAQIADSPAPERAREPNPLATPELYAPDCSKARALGLACAFGLSDSLGSLLAFERLASAPAHAVLPSADQVAAHCAEGNLGADPLGSGRASHG